MEQAAQSLSLSNETNGHHAVRQRRLANLDLARAIAIAMVIGFHLATLVPNMNGWVHLLTQGGRYGVDLFFVLSGFLVGGLYWRERDQTGSVAPLRFVMRRAFRTVPPYFIAMILSWLIARAMFGTPFDPSFLLMVQNYSPEIVYFKGSWSLCIEEHFYLILPIVLSAVVYLGGRQRVPMAMVLIASMSLVARIASWNGQTQAFGYYYTATHFHLDGLALGVLASYIVQYRPDLAELCGQYRRAIFSSCAVMVFLTAWFSEAATYIFVPAMLSSIFTAMILVLAVQEPYGIARLPVVENLAKVSYSYYLTHYVAIYFAVVGLQSLGCHNVVLLALGGLGATIISGRLFYSVVERPTFWLRDRLVGPGRRAADGTRYAKMSLTT